MYERVERSDLTNYGFDGPRFCYCSGKKELHGPCPACGGKDRLVITCETGLYFCRQCPNKGKIQSKNSEQLNPLERKRMEAIYLEKKRKEEEQEAQEKAKKLAILNKNKPWVHQNQMLLKNAEILALLQSDGINRGAVEYWKLGYIDKFTFYVDNVRHNSPVYTIPIFRGSECLTIRCRIIKKVEGDKYRPFISGLGAQYFDASIKMVPWIVMVEGEKKAIVLNSYGIPAVGIFGNYSFKEEWVDEFKRFGKIFIALDPDQAGNKGTKRILEMLKAVPLIVPGKPDDILVRKEITPSKFISLITQALYKEMK